MPPPPWPAKIVCFSTFSDENSIFLGAFKGNTMFLHPPWKILPSPGQKSADAYVFFRRSLQFSITLQLFVGELSQCFVTLSIFKIYQRDIEILCFILGIVKSYWYFHSLSKFYCSYFLTVHTVFIFYRFEYVLLVRGTGILQGNEGQRVEQLDVRPGQSTVASRGRTSKPQRRTK